MEQNNYVQVKTIEKRPDASETIPYYVSKIKMYIFPSVGNGITR